MNWFWAISEKIPSFHILLIIMQIYAIKIIPDFSTFIKKKKDYQYF